MEVAFLFVSLFSESWSCREQGNRLLERSRDGSCRVLGLGIRQEAELGAGATCHAQREVRMFYVSDTSFHVVVQRGHNVTHMFCRCLLMSVAFRM